MHVDVVPSTQLGEHDRERCVVEHEPAIEPRKERVDGDSASKARAPIVLEPTDVAGREAPNSAHGDCAPPDYHLDRPVLRIIAHGEFSPEIARDGRTSVNSERAIDVVLHLEITLAVEINGSLLFTVVG
jgi:hypothetical protein